MAVRGAGGDVAAQGVCTGGGGALGAGRGHWSVSQWAGGTLAGDFSEELRWPLRILVWLSVSDRGGRGVSRGMLTFTAMA